MSEHARLAVGDGVVRVSGDVGSMTTIGVIARIIPGHVRAQPPGWVDAKAVVAWPTRRRTGGDDVKLTTIALASLARPDEMGACATCGRHRRLYPSGHDRRCGTCLSREERRVNTHEMYGHGRRGY